MRPKWHRWAGWIGIAAGIGVIVLNDLMLIGENLRVLPFGHSEFYLLLGLGIAAGASGFLGMFDRGRTFYG